MVKPHIFLRLLCACLLACFFFGGGAISTTCAALSCLISSPLNTRCKKNSTLACTTQTRKGVRLEPARHATLDNGVWFPSACHNSALLLFFLPPSLTLPHPLFDSPNSLLYSLTHPHIRAYDQLKPAEHLAGSQIKSPGSSSKGQDSPSAHVWHQVRTPPLGLRACSLALPSARVCL